MPDPDFKSIYQLVDECAGRDQNANCAAARIVATAIVYFGNCVLQSANKIAQEMRITSARNGK